MAARAFTRHCAGKANALESVADDPFAISGVVGEYSIHEWSEALAP